MQSGEGVEVVLEYAQGQDDQLYFCFTQAIYMREDQAETSGEPKPSVWCLGFSAPGCHFHMHILRLSYLLFPQRFLKIFSVEVRD